MATRPQRPKATKIYSDITTRKTIESDRRTESKKQFSPSGATGPLEQDFKRPVKSRISTNSNKTVTKSTKTSPIKSQQTDGHDLVNGLNGTRAISSTTRLSERSLDSKFSRKETRETRTQGHYSKISTSSSAYSKVESYKPRKKLSERGPVENKKNEQLLPNDLKSIDTKVVNVGRSSKPFKEKAQSDDVIINESKVKNPIKQNPHANKSLKMMILNMKGRDDRNGAIAERRRHIFHNVIQKHLPGLVLVQDFKLPSITTKFWSKSPLPSQYAYTGTEDTGIMFDETIVDIQDVPIAEFRNTLDGLHRHANNKLKRIVPTEFDPFPRMCTRLVTMKQGASVHFICISWRGDFSLNGTKLKHSQKLDFFEYLMEFLRIVKEKLKLPILIGGNFYVDLYSIEHLVQSPFHLCIYDASMRRTVPGIIDYFIITEDLMLTDITWVSLREDTTAYQPTGVMDHDPVKAVLSGKPGKGNGPKRMVNPNKWNASKVSESKKRMD